MRFFGKIDFDAARQRMVRDQMPDIPSHVLEVMARVPRHLFVPESRQSLAYEDMPLPIGHGQTISQPYIVALMTAQLDPLPTDRVLEIGTGSGYQAAVLAQLVAEVYTMEIVEPLAQRAKAVLRQLSCNNVQVRVSDGSAGWPEAAPFDSVIVTCAPEIVPLALVQQLKDGGRLIIPVGPPGTQELRIYEKHQDHLAERQVFPVRFVPMTGAVEHEGGTIF